MSVSSRGVGYLGGAWLKLYRVKIGGEWRLLSRQDIINLEHLARIWYGRVYSLFELSGAKAIRREK